MEFRDEIVLSLGEVKLVNQKIAAVRHLALFTNQKRIEESGRGDGKQFALPAVLLVNDQVKIIEVASGVDSLLPGFFREDSVKSGCKEELLYRNKLPTIPKVTRWNMHSDVIKAPKAKKKMSEVREGVP